MLPPGGTVSLRVLPSSLQRNSRPSPSITWISTASKGLPRRVATDISKFISSAIGKLSDDCSDECIAEISHPLAPAGIEHLASGSPSEKFNRRTVMVPFSPLARRAEPSSTGAT